jgi:3-methyladenine DNA glycosylase AlkD
MKELASLIKKTKSLYAPERAEHSKYFFKNGPGQYGEGDVFWGLSVPEMRSIAKEYYNLALEEVFVLLKSEIHELRLIGLTILVEKYQKAKTDKERFLIYNFYLQNRAAANNWDLVDLSVYKIMGDYLVRHPEKRNILYKLIKSKNIWDRRLAMVSAMAFIRNNESEDVINLASALLNDKEDLMHKASGWMLRELGKRNEKILINFLDKNVTKMPRTMLRYAIEKFSEEKRQKYLKIKK